MALKRDIELWTDFHSPKKSGVHVSTVGVGGGTLLRPDVGESVKLFDGEGNTCIGVVESVFDVNSYVLVHTRADPATWKTEVPVIDLMTALAASIGLTKTARSRIRPGGVKTETDMQETKIAVG